MGTIKVTNTTVISGKVFTWFCFMNVEQNYQLAHGETFVFPSLTEEQCYAETKLSFKETENLIEEIFNNYSNA